MSQAPIIAKDINTKPNILVIWGDNIGAHNISAYSHGVMGYQTLYIYRIANEDAMFTHYYANKVVLRDELSLTKSLQIAQRNGKVGFPSKPLKLI